MASQGQGRKKSQSADKGEPPSDNSDMVECPDCKKQIGESDEALQCEICENWFHSECQGITKATYKLLAKNARSRVSNNHVHWYCRICDTSAVQIITLVAKISKKHDQLDMQVQEHEGKIDTLNEKMSSWEDEIDDLKSTLSTHESDIKAIKHDQETKLTEMLADIRSHEEKIKALESNRMINWPTSTESESANGSSMETRGTGTRIVNEVTRSVN